MLAETFIILTVMFVAVMVQGPFRFKVINPVAVPLRSVGVVAGSATSPCLELTSYFI